MYRHNMELAAREQLETQEREQEYPQSKFINRVSEINAVKNTWGYALNTYNKAKQYNGLVKLTLDTAEKSVAFAACKALPVVHRFDSQIAYADGVACRTLDNIEHSVETSKTSGAVPAVQEFLQVTIEDTLATVDSLLDHYLPASDEEKVSENGSTLNGSVGTLEHAKHVGGKLHRRLLTRTHHALSNVAFAVEWLHFLQKHANSTNAAVQARLTEYRTAAIKLFNELSKDEAPEGDEQKALALARLVAQRLKKIYSNLPPLQPIIAIAQSYTADLYSHVAKAARIEDVSSAVVQQARDKLRLLISLVEHLSSNLLVSKQA